MKRMMAVLAGLLLMGGSLAAQSQDRLLPAKKRITDEALARDWALIHKWLVRADSLPRNPGDIYARARAIALLEFVGTEYDRANRSPVLDTSFAHAVAIVERIEAGQTGYEAVSEPVGAGAVAPGLWQRIDSLQGADTNHCAEAEIARAQVKLLLAVEEHRTGGPECSAPIVKEVEALIDEIKRLMAACAPAPVDTVPSEPAPAGPEAAAPTIDTVRMARSVHFAFDRAKLSPATKQVLDQVAAQLVALPDAMVQLDAFTDPQGQAKYNRQLSARRGEAVRKYLVERGVNPARISVVPLGATAPIRDPGMPRLERYALDRRVDIQILPMSGVVIERYEQFGDVQATVQHRRSRGRAKPSGRNSGK
jgi:outer membrane protein OmpA-like peptidoglycan-associated protein